MHQTLNKCKQMAKTLTTISNATECTKLMTECLKRTSKTATDIKTEKPDILSAKTEKLI